MKENWQYKKLGEVGKIITGNTPSTKDYENYSSEDFCFIKPGDIDLNGISYINNSEFQVSKKAFENSRKLPIGSVLITCIGIIGKVAILQIPAICNQQINAIIPSEVVSSKFIAYSILGIRTYLNKIANAPVVPIINKKDFSEIKIPVPPISVQERIVAELDLLSRIIEKQKQQLKELDTLAQSIFYSMFGDPITNEKNWEFKFFKDFFQLKSGDGLSEKNFIKGDFPVYGGNGISGFHNSYNKSGDHIIMGRVGVYCGNVRFVKGNFWLTDNAFDTYFDNNIFNYQFLCFLLNSVKLNQYANHAAQPVISNIGLKNILIIAPPLSLQNEFAEKIEKIEKHKEAINKRIEETQKLFDYTMEKYFG